MQVPNTYASACRQRRTTITTGVGVGVGSGVVSGCGSGVVGGGGQESASVINALSFTHSSIWLGPSPLSLYSLLSLHWLFRTQSPPYLLPPSHIIANSTINQAWTWMNSTPRLLARTLERVAQHKPLPPRRAQDRVIRPACWGLINSRPKPTPQWTQPSITRPSAAP
eukprot:353015-Chlamydomonas_euryale.AAC.4